MAADTARIETDQEDSTENGKVEHRELKTKEDIKNYFKQIM